MNQFGFIRKMLIVKGTHAYSYRFRMSLISELSTELFFYLIYFDEIQKKITSVCDLQCDAYPLGNKRDINIYVKYTLIKVYDFVCIHRHVGSTLRALRWYRLHLRSVHSPL
jgi:hypothetical protein